VGKGKHKGGGMKGGMGVSEVKSVCDSLEVSPGQHDKGLPVFKKTKPSGKSARSGKEPTFKPPA